MFLKKGEVIGSVHSVAAVIPMLKMGDLGSPKREAKVNVVDVDESDESGADINGDCVIPKFNLSHLNEEQRNKQDLCGPPLIIMY